MSKHSQTSPFRRTQILRIAAAIGVLALLLADSAMGQGFYAGADVGVAQIEDDEDLDGVSLGRIQVVDLRVRSRTDLEDIVTPGGDVESLERGRDGARRLLVFVRGHSILVGSVARKPQRRHIEAGSFLGRVALSQWRRTSFDHCQQTMRGSLRSTRGVALLG